MNPDPATKAADLLLKFDRHQAEKRRRIEALLALYVKNPGWPIEAMVREYSMVLDTVDGHGYLEQVRRDASPEGMDARWRGGRTKRIRTREQCIAAATTLVLGGGGGEYFVKTVSRITSISDKALYNYFPTKADLLWAVYDRLIQPALNPATERS